jgi:predicted RNase H-like HicB family nuclease
MTVKIVLEHGEDGYIVAHCPSLKGCWSQGKTREEATANIREAIALYLEPSPGEVIADESHEVLELAL